MFVRAQSHGADVRSGTCHFELTLVSTPPRLVYRKSRKRCATHTEGNLCLTNDSSVLQSQANVTYIKGDLNKKPGREITYALTNRFPGSFKKQVLKPEQGRGEQFPPDKLELARTF